MCFLIFCSPKMPHCIATIAKIYVRSYQILILRKISWIWTEWLMFATYENHNSWHVWIISKCTQTNVIIACLYPEVTFDHSRFETFAHLSRQQAIFWWKMAKVAFFGAQNVGFGQKIWIRIWNIGLGWKKYSLLMFLFSCPLCLAKAAPTHFGQQ